MEGRTVTTHPSEDQLEQFLADRLAPAVQERVVRHLLAGCGACSRKLVEQAPDLRLQKVAESSRRKTWPDPLRDRALAAALRQEARWRTDEKKLARSLEILRAHPRGYDGLTHRQVQTLHGPALVEALLQRSFELRFRDPRAMRWLTFNAVKAAEGLRPEEHDPCLGLDLQARAWAELANAYRITNEFAEAEGALNRARALLRRGSGDLRLLARMSTFEAALRSDQRRLGEACELLDGVYRLCVKLQDRHLAGLALISKAVSLGHGRRHQQSLQLYRRGLPLLDTTRDPHLASVSQQGFITSMTGAGEYGKAGQLLMKSGLRQSSSGKDPILLLKIRWLEGRILAGIGRTPSAERALIGVYNEFLELEKKYDAAIVGLDLLPLFLKAGKLQEVRRNAREIYGILRDLGIPQEAAKAERYLY